VERRCSPARVVLRRGHSEVGAWRLGCERVDLDLVDDLARLQLMARRLGCSILLVDADAELMDLLGLTGLRDVLAPPSRVEVVGEPERREQGGVEEVVVTDDPVA
jgi:hypothetical protein